MWKRLAFDFVGDLAPGRFQTRPMSQKPAPKTIARPRVSSGIPWWIWVLLLIVGGGIGFSLLQKSIPDDPAVLFADAITAFDKQEPMVIQENLQKLKAYPNFVGQQNLLDGMLLLSSSRPLKAIPVLQEASTEQAVRPKALFYLGMAYAQAENPLLAISTFESAIKDDENAHNSRQSLALLLQDLMAWNESMVHLTFLAEKEYKPGQTLKTRGEMRFELGQYKEAADDLEAAIKADKTDPTNSVKADRLVQCLTRMGELSRAEEYAGLLDRPDARERLVAEKLFADGKTTELMQSLERIRRESPTDARAALLMGKAMLKESSAEKAAVALVIIRPILVNGLRNPELYQVAAELGRKVEDETFANLAQQNADRLTELNKEYDEALVAVIGTREGFDVRLRLAELAIETGRFELAGKVTDSMLRSDPDKGEQVFAVRQRLFEPVPELFSTKTSTSPAAPEQAAAAPGGIPTPTPEATPTPDSAPDAEKTPASGETADPAAAVPESGGGDK